METLVFSFWIGRSPKPTQSRFSFSHGFQLLPIPAGLRNAVWAVPEVNVSGRLRNQGQAIPVIPGVLQGCTTVFRGSAINKKVLWMKSVIDTPRLVEP